MDDVTDSVFRQMIVNCAEPDLLFTEFVNVDGLQSPGRQKLISKLQYSSKERPIIAQIWGKSPENFYKTASELVAMGFAGIDINMGCPDKSIVKNGSCAALINNRQLAVEIIQAVKEGSGGKIAISVKTRLGFNQVDLSWPALLLRQKLNMLIIHGRTRSQRSKVPADWEAIADVRQLRDQLSPETLIVGNGDVLNRQHGQELAEKYMLDGIMIGRGVFQDPFAFSLDSPWPSYSRSQKLSLFAKQVKLYQKTAPNHRRPIQTLNKFCKLYVNGFDGAKELREQLMSATSSNKLLSLLKKSINNP